MLPHISNSPNTPSARSPRLKRAPRGAKRQPLSCLACRHHKLRCDRQVPCGTCVRYGRDDVCQQNPAQRHAAAQAVAVAVRPPLPLSVDASRRVAEPPPAVSNSAALGSSAPRQQNSVNRTKDGRPLSLSETVIRPVRTMDGLSITTAGEQLRNQPSPSSGGGTPLAAFMSESSIWSLLDLEEADSKKFWRSHLVNVLPTRAQCDILVTYFVEHANWLYQPVHVPSFRRQYALFWETHVDDVDFLWLSLLLAVISVSAIYIPFEAIEIVNIPKTSIRKLAKVWHFASQQALQAGEYETKPQLVQFQTFIVTRLYYFATNNFELLNSRLGQAVRHAQAMNLDKDCHPSKCLEDELRHRLWWDLIDTDTFQAICLDRAPLIRVDSQSVPLPLNCNDVDITPESITIRPIEQPTEATLKLHQGTLFQLINRRLCSGNGTYLKSYENVLSMENELLGFMKALPWYLQPNANSSFIGYEFVKWQHHILRTCVATQRIRMHKPFLSNRSNESWRNCAEAAHDALTVYKEIRTETSPAFRQKFFAGCYQIFSVAVTLAALLLVERAEPFPDALVWLERLAADLKQVEDQGCFVPLAQHGRTVLLNMISYYEHRRPYTPHDAEKLVSDISVILGGEQATRAYLDRCPSAVAHPMAMTTAAAAETPAHGTVQLDGEPTSEDCLADMETPNFGYQTFDTNIPLDLLNWDMTGLLTDALNSAS